jgi:hypothetical protein
MGAKENGEPPSGEPILVSRRLSGARNENDLNLRSGCSG